MTEREMLEYAAKAFGLYAVDDISDCWTDANTGEEGEPLYPPHGFVTLSGVWNPLLDDGDAFRLAVELHAFVDVIHDRTQVVIGLEADVSVPHEDDQYAATRLAITRAAAEIGKAMEGEKK